MERFHKFRTLCELTVLDMVDSRMYLFAVLAGLLLLVFLSGIYASLVGSILWVIFYAQVRTIWQLEDIIVVLQGSK